MLNTYKIHIFPPVYLILSMFIGVFFFDGSVTLHSYTLIAILVSIILAIAFCEILLKILKFIDRWRRIRVFTRSKRDLLIGLAVMSICGAVFLWVPYQHGDKRWLVIYTTIVSTATSVIFFVRFLRRVKKYLQLEANFRFSNIYQRWTEVVMLCQFLIFIYAAYNLPKDKEKPKLELLMVVVFHMLYILGYGFTLMDFFMVCAGAVELSYQGKFRQDADDQEPRDEDVERERAERNLRILDWNLENAGDVERDLVDEDDDPDPNTIDDFEEEEEEVQNEIPKDVEEVVEGSEVDESVGTSPDYLTCEICCLPYSTRRLPRVLKDCGHTVCVECVKKLVDSNTAIFRCPICRNSSILKETQILSLPINHALLNIVQETDNCLNCKFCNLPYNDQHVPRILRECGHTACQNCVEDVMEKGTDEMTCVACRMVTELKPEELPKNYALLKVIREVKNFESKCD